MVFKKLGVLLLWTKGLRDKLRFSKHYRVKSFPLSEGFCFTMNVTMSLPNEAWKIRKFSRSSLLNSLRFSKYFKVKSFLSALLWGILFHFVTLSLSNEAWINQGISRLFLEKSQDFLECLSYI